MRPGPWTAAWLGLCFSLACGAAWATGAYTIYNFPGGVPRESPPKPVTPPTGQDLADMQLKPLVAAGDPPSAIAGLAQKGDAFFRVGVRHGVTGVLTSEVRGHGWIFSDRPLPAGQPVFGLPMAGSDGAGLVWCAPQAGTEAGVRRWRTICLPQRDGAFAWIEAHPALMTLNLSWPEGLGHSATTPVVARGPADLPPMVLSYAFAGWDKNGWLQMLVQIDWGEGPQPLHTIVVPPAADGAAHLRLMGGELTLRPEGAKNVSARVAVLTPPKPDAPIED